MGQTARTQRLFPQPVGELRGEDQPNAIEVAGGETLPATIEEKPDETESAIRELISSPDAVARAETLDARAFADNLKSAEAVTEHAHAMLNRANALISEEIQATRRILDDLDARCLQSAASVAETLKNHARVHAAVKTATDHVRARTLALLDAM